jgi:hypothetical protein
MRFSLRSLKIPQFLQIPHLQHGYPAYACIFAIFARLKRPADGEKALIRLALSLFL